MKKSVIVIILIGVIVLTVALIVGIKFLPKSSKPEFVVGEETLEVTILDTNNNPVSNLEVDLWRAEKLGGAPSAGFLKTDEQGVAVFKIPEGNYMIGFNQINFPNEFIYPRQTAVEVKRGLNQKTIVLEPK